MANSYNGDSIIYVGPGVVSALYRKNGKFSHGVQRTYVHGFGIRHSSGAKKRFRFRKSQYGWPGDPEVENLHVSASRSDALDQLVAGVGKYATHSVQKDIRLILQFEILDDILMPFLGSAIRGHNLLYSIQDFENKARTVLHRLRP